MARMKYQTLTEQMFYVLLCLKKENCGIDIMKEVEVITNNRIKIGPGTLYILLDKFVQAGFIQETKVENRKKSYLITNLGEELLMNECNRLETMLRDIKNYGTSS